MAIVDERYAEALMAIAVEEDAIAQYMEEAITLKQVLDTNPEVSSLYLNPKISIEEKEQFTKDCFEKSFSENLVGLIVLVIKNGRSTDLLGILENFIAQTKEYLKIGVVYVESAYEISAAVKAKLEEKILNTTDYKSLEMNYSVNKELIGGVKIRIKDRIVDNSIQTKLQGMAKELYQVQI